jgi:signal transduction histidine kinase
VEALRAEIEETNRGVVALSNSTCRPSSCATTELKSRFLAYMSHEFRTPIVSIQSITRLLIDRVDGPLTPEQEKQVGLCATAPSLPRWSTTCSTWPGWKRPRGRVARLVRHGGLFDALRGMFKPVLTNPRCR